MTKRAVIIASSIIAGLLLTLTILFGMVFRVRSIDVVYSQDFSYITQIDDIVKASKLNKNDSVFAINREKAISNIEKAYPYAKVSGFTLGANSVKIKLSNRKPFYYFVENEICYVLDEDCKVLEKITQENYNQKGYNLILLNNVFSAGESVVAGQFLSNKYSDVCSNLYKALYINATLNIGEDKDNDGEPDEKYLEREDMCNVLDSIKFTQVYELENQVDKLIMTTSYGCKISIINPQSKLDIKINNTFSALRALIKYDEEHLTTKSQSGTIAIRYSYDDNNNVSIVTEYHAD